MRYCGLSWFCLLCLASVSFAADQAADLEKLLQQLDGEWVAIRPGEDQFPRTFRFLATDGGKGEQTPREIVLSQPFSIGRYEVPQNLYTAVMGANPSRWKGPRNSVEMMSWQDVQTFCQRLTTEMRRHKLLAEDEVIRLPTEIEWEYCCRAGTTTRYSFGDEIRRDNDPAQRNSILDEYGWYTGNAAGNDPPVGALKPNPWGLYDVHGYLWEFTADVWSPVPGQKNQEVPAAAPAEPQMITLKGGSWKDPAERLSSSARRSFPATGVDDAVGFRLVKAKIR